MISHYEVIFFDAGGTLLHPFPSVGSIYQKIAAKHGCYAEADYLEKIFREAWRKRDGISNLASHNTEKIEREWWRNLVEEVFCEIGGFENFEEFFTELYDVFAHPDSWRLYPDVPEILEELKKRGKKLAIISNWDSRLFKICEGLDLGKYFEFVLASAVFGASKPGPKIFQEALRRAGVEAKNAVHVGDSIEDDVRGATGVGMQAILIDRHLAVGQKSRPDFDRVPTIQNLRELL